jgi:hypothetical protein
MDKNILAEYDNFDFGFTAVDSEEQVVEKPVVKTEEIVQPVSEELEKFGRILQDLYGKIDRLEEFVQASVGSGSFDADAHRVLIERESQEKLKKLEGLILPLLINLMKNPEKDYIKWPNRVSVIESQMQKILAITRPAT